MPPTEVAGFAGLCQSLSMLDTPVALSVLDPFTGKFLEHCQLRQDPRYKATWDMSYANEVGRFCQGIGSGATPNSKWVAGINTFFIIDYHDIPDIPVQASPVSPHTHALSYGAKAQITPEADASERLDEHRKHRIQEIVSLLLYYDQAVDNKLLIALSTIAARQSYATLATEQVVHILLDYVATYPADGIVYRSSDMILCAHADAGFLNETNSCSRAGAHIFLSENDPFPRFNGVVLSIAQIIKFVMASSAESELAALYVTAREMIPHRQALIVMGWPQPKWPIQTDNSTAAGVTNKTIVPRRVKMMNMRLW
jgi:hypothetical protein